MLTINTMADLKRELPNLTFEQVYNNMNRATPHLIPEKVRGPRAVLSVHSGHAQLALAKGFESASPKGARWDFPPSKNVKFVNLKDCTEMTVTHDDSDWTIVYLIRKA